jgi:hypothetical protein
LELLVIPDYLKTGQEAAQTGISRLKVLKT